MDEGTPGERAELTERRDTLARRLETGWRVVERAKTDGTDKAEVDRLETGWVAMPRHYERACEALDGADGRD